MKFRALARPTGSFTKSRHSVCSIMMEKGCLPCIEESCKLYLMEQELAQPAMQTVGTPARRGWSFSKASTSHTGSFRRTSTMSAMWPS